MPTSSSLPAAECEAAMTLGQGIFAMIDAKAADYQLVKAENAIAGTPTCPGPRCWRLTYKARHTIPETMPAIIGAGGEIFVEVDLAAGSARVTGYGE